MFSALKVKKKQALELKKKMESMNRYSFLVIRMDDEKIFLIIEMLKESSKVRIFKSETHNCINPVTVNGRKRLLALSGNCQSIRLPKNKNYMATFEK